MDRGVLHSWWRPFSRYFAPYIIEPLFNVMRIKRNHNHFLNNLSFIKHQHWPLKLSHRLYIVGFRKLVPNLSKNKSFKTMWVRTCLHDTDDIIVAILREFYITKILVVFVMLFFCCSSNFRWSEFIVRSILLWCCHIFRLVWTLVVPTFQNINSYILFLT